MHHGAASRVPSGTGVPPYIPTCCHTDRGTRRADPHLSQPFFACTCALSTCSHSLARSQEEGPKKANERARKRRTRKKLQSDASEDDDDDDDDDDGDDDEDDGTESVQGGSVNDRSRPLAYVQMPRNPQLMDTLTAKFLDKLLLNKSIREVGPLVRRLRAAHLEARRAAAADAGGDSASEEVSGSGNGGGRTNEEEGDDDEEMEEEEETGDEEEEEAVERDRRASSSAAERSAAEGGRAMRYEVRRAQKDYAPGAPAVAELELQWREKQREMSLLDERASQVPIRPTAP